MNRLSKFLLLLFFVQSSSSFGLNNDNVSLAFMGSAAFYAMAKPQNAQERWLSYKNAVSISIPVVTTSMLSLWLWAGGPEMNRWSTSFRKEQLAKIAQQKQENNESRRYLKESFLAMDNGAWSSFAHKQGPGGIMQDYMPDYVGGQEYEDEYKNDIARLDRERSAQRLMFIKQFVLPAFSVVPIGACVMMVAVDEGTRDRILGVVKKAASLHLEMGQRAVGLISKNLAKMKGFLR